MIEDNAYKTGAKLALENVNRLYQAALLLEGNKQFPIANSIMILAAEEASKAFAINMKSLGLLADDEEWFKEIFSQHKVKIDQIRSHTFVSTFFGKMFEFEIAPLIEYDGNLPIEKIEQVRKQSVRDLINWLKEEKYSKTEFGKELGWWNTVQSEKENGFYLGYKNGKWISPDKINKDQYFRTKKNVSGYIEKVREAFEANTSKERLKEFIDYMKNNNSE